MIRALWDWLKHGPSETYLPASWLANTDRLDGYTLWTEREKQSAFVSKGVDHFRRQAFWQSVESKRTRQWPRSVA